MASSGDQKCVSLSCSEGGENWPLKTVLVEEKKKQEEEEEEEKKKEEKEDEEEEEEESQKKEEEEKNKNKNKQKKKKKKKKKEEDKLSDVDVISLYKALTQVKKTQERLNEKLSQTGLTFVQKFAVDVTLDPETANPFLIISDDGKQVRRGDIKQNVPENPKRFDDLVVLSKEGFSSGRFYYEVQVKGEKCVLGVAGESVDRKEDIDLPSPDNGFWILCLIDENVCAVCDNPAAFLFLSKTPEKVGVFVDYEEGLVSFYEVESRSHIYSFTDQTFTEKLYPCFCSADNDKGKNSNPMIITPVKMN